MARARVSLAVVKRLPKYYRYLGMIEQKGIIRVSSQELSSITGLTASQIRQDLNHFGGFGQQGYGYNVEELKSEIEKIMGINKSYKAIILGCGNIGKAIMNYRGFKSSGFNIVDVFDHGKKVGTKISDYEIKDIDKIARDIIEEAGYGDYFPHRLGHGLGLEEHEYQDISSVNNNQLEAGMVITIEPGIYVPHVAGVRIEDDILVTENGYEILTQYEK